MVSFFRTDFASHSRRRLAVILAFTWCAGLILGAYTAILADIPFFSMMRTAPDARVSIPGLLAVMLLPFLFSAFAVYVSSLWLLVPIAFSKAFLFSYLSTGLSAVAGTSGWLLRFLWMFSDCLTVPVLLWFWFSACSKRREAALINAAAALPVLIGICYLDLQVISPFLVNLLS